MKPNLLGSNPSSVIYNLLSITLIKFLSCCTHFLICKVGIKIVLPILALLLILSGRRDCVSTHCKLTEHACDGRFAIRKMDNY